MMGGFSEQSHQKIFELIQSFDGPVGKEVLHWEIDYGDSAQNFSDLGPRPRRSALFEIIGNLVDRNLFELTICGVKVSEVEAG